MPAQTILFEPGRLCSGKAARSSTRRFRRASVDAHEGDSSRNSALGWCAITLLLLSLTFVFPSTSRAEDLVRIGVFSRDAVSFVAQGKGFFQAEGIRAEYTSVSASVDLMQNFADGKFDLIHTTADNVIAWAEGQGADHKTHDFSLIIGGRKGVTNELVVAPEIKTFDDLKGKRLGVDAYNTGYAPVLVYILNKHGLALRKDYDMIPLGAGGARTESLRKGETAGAITVLTEDLKQRGFHVLARKIGRAHV